MSNYVPYIKKYWYSFVLGPIFMVLEACGEFILPYINANIINIGAANSDIPYIIKNGIYMMLIAAFMLIAGVLGANFGIRASSRLAAGVRNDTFCKIQTFSFANIDEFSTGSLITRITNDITQIQNFTQSMLRGMFRSPVMIIGALIMSFFLNQALAWVFVVVVPILAVTIAIIIRIASPRYTIMQKQLDALNNSISETITNERVIKSFVREDYEKERFGIINRDLAQKSTNALKMMLLLQPVTTLAMNTTTLAVVWIAGKQIMVGDMELGTLTAFITYLSQVLMALTFLANIALQGTRAAASGRRIAEILHTQVTLTNPDSKTEFNSFTTDVTASVDKNNHSASHNTSGTMSNFSPSHVSETLHGTVEFRDVSFRYFKKNTEQILSHINLRMEAGEFVGIIGSTGSGKSTLVSLIPRLYDVDEGSVLVGGIDVRNYQLSELRDLVSMVLQKNTLFSGTILENLCWGNENASKEEVIAACRAAQADSFIQSFPDGYCTELGQGGVNLSGGQKQRLCIARALLKKPNILILDDSTSAVDTATDAAIRQELRTGLASTTKIIIAQRIMSVIDADKIIVLDDGTVVGCGSHEELMKTCETYREIYCSQKDAAS